MGRDKVELSLVFYYCQEGGEGLCKIGSVVWTVPIKIDAVSKSSVVSLKHTVKQSPF